MFALFLVGKLKKTIIISNDYRKLTYTKRYLSEYTLQAFFLNSLKLLSSLLNDLLLHSIRYFLSITRMLREHDEDITGTDMTFIDMLIECIDAGSTKLLEMS